MSDDSARFDDSGHGSFYDLQHFSAFWTDGRTERFRDLAPAAMSTLGLVPAVFDESGSCRLFVDGAFGPDVRAGSSATYRRWVKQGQVPGKAALSGMLFGLGKLISQPSRQDELEGSRDLAELKELFEKFLAEGQYVRTGKAAVPGPSESMPTAPVASVLALLGRGLAIGSTFGVEADTRFFYDDDGQEIHFDIFRFSSKPGFLQRSFTAMHRSTTDLPACRFNNFFRFRGQDREARGVVLPFRNYSLFLGHSDTGRAPKLMVVPNSPPQDSYEGLLISDDRDDGLLAARFLMRRSEFRHSSEVQSGKLSIEDAGLSKEELDSIRNEVKFGLEEDVYDESEEALPDSVMVERVGQLINPPGEPARLKYKNGDPFNPAAHRHYTFNSALKRR